MDLSQLSTEDLQALKTGDLTKVSTAGLQALRGQSAAPAPAAAAAPAPPATFGHTLAGEGDLAATALSGIARGVPNAVQDLYRTATGQPQLPPGQRVAGQATLGPAGKDLVNTVGGMLPQGPTAADADDKIRQGLIEQAQDKFGATPVGHALQTAGNTVTRVGGDVMDLLPVVPGLTAASEATGLAGAARRAAAIEAPVTASVTDTAAHGLGLRKVTDLGKTLAGSSTGPALAAQNAAAGDAAIGAEAGLPKGVTPSYTALTDARSAPGQVMKDAAASIPDGPLNAAAQAKLAQAGVPKGGTLDADLSTQAEINNIRQRLQLADTGPQHAANLATLRQQGFEAVDADTAAERNLGRAKLDMADAVQGHIMDSLPADGPVSAQEFLDARKALAKNYTATSVLKGNSFDLQKLARIQRNAPGLLDGDMNTVANFANNNPEITGHASTLRSPNLLGDLSNISLTKPASYVQPFTGMFGRALLKRGGVSPPVAPDSLGAQFEHGQ